MTPPPTAGRRCPAFLAWVALVLPAAAQEPGGPPMELFAPPAGEAPAEPDPQEGGESESPAPAGSEEDGFDASWPDEPWQEEAFGSDIGEMSLEELMDIDVTIASRSMQGLRETPAAVYVITGDEIRRAGHSSIPEALRMVPGFYVSRWSHVAWDVTSRGFGTGIALTNLAYLNQLLVLIDGVVVYSPLFAGVWWPMQDVDLADVDRIEVVRGPGGFLWGANGVHGVVHIITKKASDTQGARLTLRNGTDDRHGSVRWGGRLGESGHFRVWVDHADYDTLANPFLGIRSNWDLTSAGFRADWKTDSGRDVTVWGRAQEGDFDEIEFDLTTFDTFLGDGQKDARTLFASLADEEEGWRVQTWWTRDRQDYPSFLDIDIDTFDVEYLRRTPLGETHTLSWGVGYRRIESELVGDDPFYLDFDPRRVDQDNLRAFLLDTIELPEANLQFVVGTQVEHTEFTDFEIQPTGRALWSPSRKLNLWAAVSGPVRTPSLEERTLSQDSAIVGNPAVEAENATIYELGVRRQFGERVGMDLALFYNEYDDLILEETDPVTLETTLANAGEGEAYGAELAVDVVATERWSLRSAYSYFEGDFELSSDGSSLDTDERSPKHIFNLRSYYDLGEDWEFDAGFYVVEGLGPDLSRAEYDRLDLRLGWRPSDCVRLSAGVQNVNGRLRSELDEFDNNRRQFFFEVELTP